MKRTSIVLSGLVVILLVIVTLSISVNADSGSYSDRDFNVTFQSSEAAMLIGDTYQIIPETQMTYIWYSDNPQIASVNVFSGLVTAVNYGETIIHAYYMTADNLIYRGDFSVHVVKPEFDSKFAIVAPSESFDLTILHVPATADVQWSIVNISEEFVAYLNSTSSNSPVSKNVYPFHSGTGTIKAIVSINNIQYTLTCQLFITDGVGIHIPSNRYNFIQNKGSRLFLCYSSYLPMNGSQVVEDSFSNGISMDKGWCFVLNDDDTYSICVRYSNLLLGTKYNEATDSYLLALCNSSNIEYNTKWKIVSIGNNDYLIVSMLSNDSVLCLSDYLSTLRILDYQSLIDDNSWRFLDTSQYLGVLPYWHAVMNDNKVYSVAYMQRNPYLDDECITYYCSYNADDYSGYYRFFNACNQIQNEWGTALNISFDLVSNASNAQIVIKAVDEDYYRTINPSGWGDVALGKTNVPNDINIGYAIHDNNQIFINRITQQRICYIYIDEDLNILTPTEKMKLVVLHEVGHALGYDSHSPFKRRVMTQSYEEDTAVYSLTNEDKEHLQQIYSRFY